MALGPVVGSPACATADAADWPAVTIMTVSFERTSGQWSWYRPTDRDRAGHCPRQEGCMQEAPEPSLDARPEHVTSPAIALQRSVVDAAAYLDGRRVPGPSTLGEVYGQLAGQAASMVWIGLLRPAEDQLL